MHVRLCRTRAYEVFIDRVFYKIDRGCKADEDVKIDERFKVDEDEWDESLIKLKNTDCCWLSSDKSKPSSTLRDLGVAWVNNSVIPQRPLDSLFEVITSIWERMGF